MLDSKLDIKPKFNRIVSLAPSNTEIIFAIGSEDKLIGVTRFCDHPKEALNIPRLGGWLDIDYDKIISLNPDLVLTSSFVQNRVVEKLNKLGIHVIQYDPKTLNEVYETILNIGELTGRVENSIKLVNLIKTEIYSLSLSAKKFTKKKVYIEEWHKPPTVSGNWVPKILEFANCESLIDEGLISKEVSFDDVQKFDPDYMIVSWCGFGTKVDLNMVKNRPRWNTLSVLKEDKVIVFDDSLLNRPGPRLVEGLREIIKQVHMINEK